jgi:hypothetical protein
MAADIERRVALKMPTHRLMRKGVGKRLQRFEGHRPSVGEVMGDGMIVGGGSPYVTMVIVHFVL